MEEQATETKDSNLSKGVEQLKQMKDKLPPIDMSKADALANGFMQKVFKSVKLLSAVVILLFVVVFFFSFLYALFKGTPSLEVPDFNDEIESSISVENSEKVNEKGGRKERKEITSKYEKDIDKAVELLGNADDKQDQVYFDRIVDVMIELPEELREDFIDGLVSYLKDGKKYLEKEDKKEEKKIKFKMTDLYYQYVRSFKSAIGEWEGNVLESKATKMYAWAFTGIVFLWILIIMMIPLLLQIEENTRKLKEAK